MSLYTYDLSEIPAELRRTVRDDYERVLRGVHRTLAIDAHRWIQAAIDGYGWVGPGEYRRPVDTGTNYKNRWVHELYPDGGVFFAQSSPPILAGVIEKGRRPGKGIPSEPLAAWVQRKFGETDYKKALRIAFLISRKAKLEGRAGLSVMERARVPLRQALHANILRELRREE